MLARCHSLPANISAAWGEGKQFLLHLVPDREQNCQGGTLSRAYDLQKINMGDEYLVVISTPDKIAGRPYAGEDIAKDPSCVT